jgi:hypothetical protein
VICARATGPAAAAARRVPYTVRRAPRAARRGQPQQPSNVAWLPQTRNLLLVKKKPALQEEGVRQWLLQAASASRCGSTLGTRLAILSASPAIIEFIGTSNSSSATMIQAIIFADQKER